MVCVCVCVCVYVGEGHPTFCIMGPQRGIIHQLGFRLELYLLAVGILGILCSATFSGLHARSAMGPVHAQSRDQCMITFVISA